MRGAIGRGVHNRSDARAARVGRVRGVGPLRIRGVQAARGASRPRMRTLPLLVALSLCALTLTFAAAPAQAIGCVVGEDTQKCIVGYETRVCVTYPCNFLTVCADHGLVCADLM